MTFYRSIMVIQEPFDLELDDNGRAQLVFNIAIEKARSTVLEEEIIKILTDATVGVSNTNIFASSAKRIPDGDGPYLQVISSGGVAPEDIHNEVLPNVQKPNVQISVRALTYAAARTMIWAAHDALAAVVNQTVVL